MDASTDSSPDFDGASSTTTLASSTTSTLTVSELPSRIRRRQRKDGTEFRQGRLVSFMGTEWDGYVYLSDVYIASAQFLAVKHLNERSGAVLPHLPALMEGCDFQMTFEQRETSYTPYGAIQELLDSIVEPREVIETLPPAISTLPPTVSTTNETTGATTFDIIRPPAITTNETTGVTTFNIIHEGELLDSYIRKNNLEGRSAHRRKLFTYEEGFEDEDDADEWQHPFGIVGASYSFVTTPLVNVGSALELPVLSGSASSASLDGQPLFGRTLPTNRGDSHAVLLHYKSLGIRHVACMYIRDEWGTSYFADLQREAVQFGIDVQFFPYGDNEESIQRALEQIKASQLKHVFAILLNWKTVLGPAFDMGVLGNPEYSWIAAEQVEWTSPDFALNRTTYGDLAEELVMEYGGGTSRDSNEEDDEIDDMPLELKWAHAFNGIGQITLHVEEHPRFIAAMAEFANDNSTLRQEYINSFFEPELYQDLSWTTPDESFYQNMNYDAAIAFGLAACKTPGLFTGPELYQSIMGLQFEGVTGNVTFDPTTGTRSPESVSYRIDNLVLSLEDSDEDFIRFNSKMAVLVANDQVQSVSDYIYYDNTPVVPLPLPPVDNYEYNLVPVGFQVFGWALCAAVMAMSLGWAAWTYWERKSIIIKASQPVFLAQLCLGTFLMASASIPFGFQGIEPTTGLHVSCMLIPWLGLLGFVMALSALFSKAWRLNQLMQSGMAMRRVQVNAVDVIWPFVLLMTVNVALLLAWTLVSPLEYVREIDQENVDAFGRSVESYGTCKSQNDSVSTMYFQIPILLLDFMGLVFATYQSYRARNLPTEFSESTYLAISMASLLETLLLGGPILFMVSDDPTAFFVVGSAVIGISCLCILLPVFVPKFNKRRAVVLTVNPQRSNTNTYGHTSVVGNRSGQSSGYDTRSAPASTASGDGAEISGSLVFDEVQESHKKASSKQDWGVMSITRTCTGGTRNQRSNTASQSYASVPTNSGGGRSPANSSQPRSTVASRSHCMSIAEDGGQ